MRQHHRDQAAKNRLIAVRERNPLAEGGGQFDKKNGHDLHRRSRTQGHRIRQQRTKAMSSATFLRVGK